MELIFILAIAFIIALVIGKAVGFALSSILVLAIVATVALYLGGFLLKGLIGAVSFGISILGGVIVWIIAILVVVALIKYLTRNRV